MTPNLVLAAIYAEISHNDGDAFFTWDAASEWGDKTLTNLLEAKLLATTTKSKSLICSACHYGCFESVVYTAGLNKADNRAFIVCGEPEMQAQMGRIAIPLERLQRWKSSTFHLANVIASYLELEPKEITDTHSDQIHIGLLKTKRGRRQLSLHKRPLEFEINQRHIPVDAVLMFENDKLIFDRTQLDNAATEKALPKSKAYISSTAKREARKTQTQLMYQDWENECKKIQTLNPSLSSSQIAKKIADLKIGRGRSSETIRKNMNY